MPAPDRPGIRSLADRFREEQLEANEGLAPFVDPARLEALEAAVFGLAESARERAAGAGAPAEPVEEGPG
jgi:hypothetical protein